MSRRNSYKKRGLSYARKKRFINSQKFHLRLNGKHSREGNKVKANYHADCYNEQKKSGRILTRAERRKIYALWSQEY